MKPKGQQITLAVIRHEASKATRRIGTVFMNPGGPGDTGVGLIRDAGNDFDKFFGGRFDIISWDPRGTYASSPIKCFRSTAEADAFWKGTFFPTTAAESNAYAAKTTQLAQRCGQVMGPLLAHLSTTDTVRDMDHIRDLAGLPTITFVGLSYGTFLGQMYANMFPARVRAMLLDGILYPVTYVENAEVRTVSATDGTDEVFARFIALCEQAGPQRCALAGHGETAAQRVARLFAKVRLAPIQAPKADPPGKLRYSDLQTSSFSPMRDPHLWPEYAKMLNSAVEGDATDLTTAAEVYRSPAAFDEATKSSAISCLDGPANKPVSDWPAVIGNLVARSKMWGLIQGWWLWAPCASNWSVTSNDRYTGPWNVKTKVPILLIGTRYDPNTSYQNAVDSSKLLGNAVLLTHDGYGHLSVHDPSKCVEKAYVRYLVDLVVPAPGTVCESDRKPFHY